MEKLKAIKEFRTWLDDPLSNTVVRWDAHYQAFVAYCQEHNEMPPWKYVTPTEPKLNLEAWVDNQKKRYKGKGTGIIQQQYIPFPCQYALFQCLLFTHKTYH